MSGNASIAEFYRRHPYPKVDRIEFDLNLLDRMHYLAHSCFDRPTPRLSAPGQRMLVAGCGTREAVMWALSLPHFQIDAVDLSDHALEIAQHLATQLNIDRIRFRLGNFQDGQALDGPYDFITSFGVLHHLKRPENGLKHLEKHLAPNGVMALMVYSHTNRWQLQRCNRVINLLTGNVPDTQARQERALDICRTAGDTTNKLKAVFHGAVTTHQNNPPQFADTMLNPQERSYSIPELIDFLDAAGLTPVSPVDPIMWDPQGCLPPDAYERFTQLPPQEKWEIGDLLNGPHLWFLAKRKGECQNRRPCLDDETLFWNVVPMPHTAGEYPVEALAVAAKPTPHRIHANPTGNGVRIGKDAAAGRTYHPIAGDLVDLIDGRRTLREIGHLAAQRHSARFEEIQGTLLGYFHGLIDDLGVATPDVTKCTQCPLRGSTGSAGGC